MNDINKKKRNRGRPRSAHDFHTVPIHQEDPDLHGLGRALLALAVHQLQKKKQEEDELPTQPEVHDESA